MADRSRINDRQLPRLVVYLTVMPKLLETSHLKAVRSVTDASRRKQQPLPPQQLQRTLSSQSSVSLNAWQVFQSAAPADDQEGVLLNLNTSISFMHLDAPR
jgi:hypothetical protein